MIDSTGLKVFGEGEWKVRKHGKERRRIWRKLHLAVDSNTHEVVCADLSLNNVTDSEAGNDSNLLIVFYVQIMPDDLVMQLHRF